MKLSLVIPAKCINDPKLKDLLRSIEAQDFDKSQMETLVITEGTSESAKAIGIRRAKGDVIGILASDNELISKQTLSTLYENAKINGAAYPIRYHYDSNDNSLNRYFALFGCNDPLAFYLNKCDRASYLPHSRFNMEGTIGDNGYFIRKSEIENTDLDNYYHIDNALEARPMTVAYPITIWHKTGGNLLTFFRKRYHYGLQHAFNSNRRWHLVDFRKRKDILLLLWFIFCSITLVEPFVLSIRGYLKIRDVAWFMHPLVCLLTVFTYGLLVMRLGIRRLSQSLSAPWTAQRA